MNRLRVLTDPELFGLMVGEKSPDGSLGYVEEAISRLRQWDRTVFTDGNGAGFSLSQLESMRDRCRHEVVADLAKTAALGRHSADAAVYRVLFDGAMAVAGKDKNLQKLWHTSFAAAVLEGCLDELEYLRDLNIQDEDLPADILELCVKDIVDMILLYAPREKVPPPHHMFMRIVRDTLLQDLLGDAGALRKVLRDLGIDYAEVVLNCLYFH